MAIPKGVRILVGLLGFIAAAVLAVGIGGYVYIRRNGDRLMNEATEKAAEGVAFARTHTKEQCEPESLDRIGRCGIGRIGCEVEVRLFFDACLRASAPSAPSVDICDDVPPMTSVVPSFQWASRRCALRGKPGSSRCMRVLQTLQDHCDRRR
jgi:hypothetical protein